MAENRMKCHIFSGDHIKVQEELSSFLETKTNIKIHSVVQSQSIVESPLQLLITITLLYTDLDVEREHILGFNNKR